MRRMAIVPVALALSLGPGTTVAADEDPSVAGAFIVAAPLGASRAWHSAIPLHDGRVLIIGGEAIDPVLGDDGEPVLDGDGYPAVVHHIHREAEVWDPATGSFGPTGPPILGGGWDPAMLLPDGRVLVFGAILANRPMSAVLWDPDTGSLSRAGTLEGVPLGGTRTALPDGRVLFVGGGVGEEEPVATAHIWDPVTGTLSPSGPPLRPRVGHTATLLTDGRVLV